MHAEAFPAGEQVLLSSGYGEVIILLHTCGIIHIHQGNDCVQLWALQERVPVQEDMDILEEFQ